MNYSIVNATGNITQVGSLTSTNIINTEGLGKLTGRGIICSAFGSDINGMTSTMSPALILGNNINYGGARPALGGNIVSGNNLSLGTSPTKDISCSIMVGNSGGGDNSYSVMNGKESASFGHNLKTSSDYQTVIGNSNLEDANNTYVFIIGNGTSNSARSNALTVD